MAQNRLANSPSYKESDKNEIPELVWEHILNMFTYPMTPKYTFNANFMVKINGREEWTMNSLTESRPGRNTWYTDGSKTGHWTGPG